MKAMNNTIKIQTTMSSLDIAQETGKRHRDVLRSIRNMENAWTKATGRKFALSDYTDITGKKMPMYELTKTECLYVATKFNDEAQARLVLRWEKLESENFEHVNVLPKQIAPLNDTLLFIDAASRGLNMNENSKLMMYQRAANVYQVPAILPDYSVSVDTLYSASALLAENGMPYSVIEFNKRMIVKGLLVEKTRPSKSKGTKKFKSLSESGLVYGENQVSPQNPRETQPMYYESKFTELLNKLS